MPLQQKLDVDQVVEAIALMNQADLQELRRRLSPILGKHRVGREPSEDTSLSLWQAIKDQIAEETPDLLQMPPEQEERSSTGYQKR